MTKRTFLTILSVVLAGVALSSCSNRLELPSNWKEQNVINLENAGFTAMTTSIDPEQSWNMAQIFSKRTGNIIVTDYSQDTKAWTKAGSTSYDPSGTFPQYYDKVTTETTEDVKSSDEEDADFFILQEGDTLPIEFNGLDCWAETTLGIYYYDLSGNRIEKDLFSEVIGKKYAANDATEVAKTEGVKSIKLEDGTAFGVYLISRTGPDIDKCYTEDVTNKFYSEAALNPDGHSHVRLLTKITATTTKTTTQNVKVQVKSAKSAKSGDENAVNVTKTGYYYWSGGKWNSTTKSDKSHDVVNITKTGYYAPVFTETNNGSATSESTTSAYHTEYNINFEDSYYGASGSDADYNDISLKVNTTIIKGSGRIIAGDYDAGPWVVLCEDLGEGADNDFNDIVFRVHRTSPTTMKIAYLAGGATRQDYVMFDSGAKLKDEIHAMFGVNIDWEKDYGISSDETRPNWFINTKYNQGAPSEGEVLWANPVYSEVVAVDSTLSMSSFYRLDIDDSSKGFSVMSNGMPEVPFSPAYKGYAPYIIAIPAYYTEDGSSEKKPFRWPAECIPIFEAYPEFAGWAADHTQNVNWYKHPVEGKVIGPDEIKEVVNNL